MNEKEELIQKAMEKVENIFTMECVDFEVKEREVDEHLIKLVYLLEKYDSSMNVFLRGKGFYLIIEPYNKEKFEVYLYIDKHVMERMNNE